MSLWVISLVVWVTAGAHTLKGICHYGWLALLFGWLLGLTHSCCLGDCRGSHKGICHYGWFALLFGWLLGLTHSRVYVIMGDSPCCLDDCWGSHTQGYMSLWVIRLVVWSLWVTAGAHTLKGICHYGWLALLFGWLLGLTHSRVYVIVGHVGTLHWFPQFICLQQWTYIVTFLYANNNWLYCIKWCGKIGNTF